MKKTGHEGIKSTCLKLKKTVQTNYLHRQTADKGKVSGQFFCKKVFPNYAKYDIIEV